MAKFSSIYKQTAPTRRTVNGENSYEKGMMWSNQALAPGYTRTLLNFESDILTGALTIPGGFHTNSVGTGHLFVTEAILETGQNPEQLLVLQPRNAYCLRAFEGITNIISVQKFSIKADKNLEESIKHQGMVMDNAICYKVLLYNPINYRLVQVTLIKDPDNSYYVTKDNIHLYKMTANPISNGFAEVWNNKFISNNKTIVDLLSREDNYLPRVKRNNYLSTFGQDLHSPHHMQTVTNCEGYGNKTFIFTKKRQDDLGISQLNSDNVEYINVFRVYGMTFTSEDNLNSDPFSANIIRLYTSDLSKTLIPAEFYTSTMSGDSGKTAYILKQGLYLYDPTEPHIQWIATTDNEDTLIVDSVDISKSCKIINPSTLPAAGNYQHDTYFGNMHTGATGYIDTGVVSARMPMSRNPLDYNKFRKALTSIAFKSSLNAIDPGTSIPGSTNILDIVRNLGTYQSAPVIEVDLNTGLIRPAKGIPTGTLSLVKLPVYSNATDLTNNTPISGIFKDDGVLDWSSSLGWIHPSELLKDSVSSIKRVGQGIRIAAYCRSAVLLNRYLRTLSTNDTLKDIYYTEYFNDVFVLDYVWNGTKWEFSFVNKYNSNITDDSNLIEIWGPLGSDSYGNRCNRHYTYVNQLSYTALVNDTNKEHMAEHNIDNAVINYNAAINYAAPTSPYTNGIKIISKLLDAEVIGNTYNNYKLDLSTTIGDLVNLQSINNREKLYGISYGHFEVTPKELLPSEAANWGYNMLSPNPYTFVCSNTPLTEPQILGALLMKDGKPLLTPLVNTPGVLYIYFSADFNYFSTAPENSGGYQLILEYKNAYDEWRTLKEYSTIETHSLLNAGVPIQLPFTSPDEITLIRITILNRNETVSVALTNGTTEEHFLTVSSLITTLAYVKDPNQSNISTEVYDLGTALGMVYWKGRLVCWGVENASNILFMSEPNEPEYFSYPNGVDIFDEDIIHVINYSDALIVLTSTKLWRLSMLTDGLSWSKTLLQQNFRITDEDVPYISVLKNMLFFKSGKQFFMLVPSSSGTIGELTIAPVSRAILDFLKDPFKNINDVIRVTYPELVSATKPINEYLVKYGTHIEQNRIFVDWWFDLTSFKNQSEHLSIFDAENDVAMPDYLQNQYPFSKEYMLIQLVYDAQTYGWTMQLHTTNHIGFFIADSANNDTDLINLALITEPGDLFQVYSGVPGTQPKRYADATWGLSISNRKTTNDYLLESYPVHQINNPTIVDVYIVGDTPLASNWLSTDIGGAPLTPTEDIYYVIKTIGEYYNTVYRFAVSSNLYYLSLVAGIPDAGSNNSSQVTPITLSPTYPRFQIFDTGYKEVSTPALKKHFREIQFTFEPREASQTNSDGDSVGIRAVLLAQIDGHTVMSAVSQEITEELQEDGTLIIKVVDQINYHDMQLSIEPQSVVPLPYLMDSELSNTFVLESSALSGVKNVKVRRAINGKGQLIRMRFTNITEANYAIINHAFISHNKNSR